MKTVGKMVLDYRRGWSLEQGFYTHPNIFNFEKDSIWKYNWLFAGFTCEIPNAGDYYTYSIVEQSVIIIRGDLGEIYAHHNTCRHRGSIICTGERGNETRLKCPYHNWVYEKNGRLKSARMMPNDFDKEANGLHSVPVRIVEGLIFISFAKDPPHFTKEASDLSAYLKPYRIADARVAYRDRYELDANWKLVVENFRECYHCGPAHPEYCSAVIGANLVEDRESVWEAKRPVWQEKGLAFETINTTTDSCNFIMRYPLRPGVDSYSFDGRKVAPPMGDLKDYDNGVLGLLTYPNLFMDAVSDYIWAMRISPVDAFRTIVDLTWLVDGKAREGEDYQTDRLTEFWKVTGEQDWHLCENNQRGIRSDKYTSGVLAPSEADVMNFHLWYINRMLTRCEMPVE